MPSRSEFTSECRNRRSEEVVNTTTSGHQMRSWRTRNTRSSMSVATIPTYRKSSRYIAENTLASMSSSYIAPRPENVGITSPSCSADSSAIGGLDVANFPSDGIEALLSGELAPAADGICGEVDRNHSRWRTASRSEPRGEAAATASDFEHALACQVPYLREVG